MFGFGNPKCPLDPAPKEWLEYRFNWLINRFGRERIKQMQVFTPTDEDFPFALDGTFEAGERMFDLICEYMGVEQGEANFKLFDPDRMKFPAGMPYEWKDTGAAGYYAEEGFRTVAISEDSLGNAERFVGTVAHELGHVLLIGRRHLDPRETADHEPLTDLLTVSFGLGIIAANSSLHERRWNTLGCSTGKPAARAISGSSSGAMRTHCSRTCAAKTNRSGRSSCAKTSEPTSRLASSTSSRQATQT